MVSPSNLLYAVSMRVQTAWWFQTAPGDVDSGWIPLICFG